MVNQSAHSVRCVLDLTKVVSVNNGRKNVRPPAATGRPAGRPVTAGGRTFLRPSAPAAPHLGLHSGQAP